MATLVFAKDLVADLHKLEKPIRQKVLELPRKFVDATHSGIHLEKISGATDPHVRTVRVDQHWRGIVFYPGESDVYVLTRVLGHDDAISYAKSVNFGINPLTGAIEVTDVAQLESVAADLADQAPTTPGGLLAAVTDDDLAVVGINPAVIPLLRKIDSRLELDTFADLLPQGQADAVQLLADGLGPMTVLDLLTATAPDTGEVEPAEGIDTADFVRAIRNPATAAEFTVYDDSTDLGAWLNEDFALWTLFLHPTQHRYAYQPAFNGPAKLTGTAGTGKTVTALHRAQFLARQAEERGDPARRILFTTYTTALATEIDRRLDLLCTPAERKRIDVINIDKLAASIVTSDQGRAKAIVRDENEILDLWNEVIVDLDLPYTAEFLNAEWETVILGGVKPIESIKDYLRTPRPGRGTRLVRNERARVWEAVETFTKRLADTGKRTFLQTADMAAKILDAQQVRPYRHAVIDEAQDLHPTQWRLVRAAVRRADEQLPNDLFIVGDAHQRIYDHRVSLSRLGIETRGRSRRLRLNYRTSHQIHRWALAARTNTPVDDLDEGEDTSAGSHSAFGGPNPVLEGHTTAKAEADAVTARVASWIDAGIAPHEIAVVARTAKPLELIESSLDAVGIPNHRLTRDTVAPEDNVAVGTIHRVKGGEYRCVAVADVSDGQLPLTSISGAVTPETADGLRHRQDMERERSLLYVAATRARDQLSVSWHGTPSPFIEVEA